jgi:hypothetical protein
MSKHFGIVFNGTQWVVDGKGDVLLKGTETGDHLWVPQAEVTKLFNNSMISMGEKQVEDELLDDNENNIFF